MPDNDLVDQVQRNTFGLETLEKRLRALENPNRVNPDEWTVEQGKGGTDIPPEPAAAPVDSPPAGAAVITAAKISLDEQIMKNVEADSRQAERDALHDPQFKADSTKIEDLERELAGLRKAFAAQKRVVDARANEVLDAEARIEELKAERDIALVCIDRTEAELERTRHGVDHSRRELEAENQQLAEALSDTVTSINDHVANTCDGCASVHRLKELLDCAYKKLRRPEGPSENRAVSEPDPSPSDPVID